MKHEPFSSKMFEIFYCSIIIKFLFSKAKAINFDFFGIGEAHIQFLY